MSKQQKGGFLAAFSLGAFLGGLVMFILQAFFGALLEPLTTVAQEFVYGQLVPRKITLRTDNIGGCQASDLEALVEAAVGNGDIETYDQRLKRTFVCDTKDFEDAEPDAVMAALSERYPRCFYWKATPAAQRCFKLVGHGTALCSTRHRKDERNEWVKAGPDKRHILCVYQPDTAPLTAQEALAEERSCSSEDLAFVEVDNFPECSDSLLQRLGFPDL